METVVKRIEGIEDDFHQDLLANAQAEADNLELQADEDEDEKGSIDFLSLGDSLVRWVNVNKINPGSNSNKLVCRPGAKIMDIRACLEELDGHYDIRNLFINVGSNEIPENDPFEVATRLTSLLAEIKVQMPLTKVYVSAILPKLGPEYIPGINDINYLMFNNCKILDVVFVQHPEFCSRGYINFDLLAGDSIHLNRLGIQQFENDIKELVPSFR